MNTAIASLALFGAAAAVGPYGYSATDIGSAHVVNNCNYPIKLCSVPASGGGYEQEDKTLAAGESWQHSWTELSNGNGWSIKLSKSDNMQSNILQYEYTFHNNGIIWYDLSCVDGNPWDKDWEITANGTDCRPKQQAYRYSTDDAFGMQSCSQDTAITVTLCTGVSADDGSAVDASSPAPSYSSASARSYMHAPPEPSSEQESSGGAKKAGEVVPTTFATAVNSGSPDDSDVTVTELETVHATAEITAYANRNRFRRHINDHARAHQHHN